MDANYKLSFLKVNDPSCLTIKTEVLTVGRMKYGERLLLAREVKQWTQAKLAEEIKNVCTQANISKLERSNATGSEFTVHFANALGVSATWLATEEGEMLDDSLRVEDKRIKAIALTLMQMKSPYLVDRVQKDLDANIELIEQVRANKS
jgi:transcriptional regulator with XRE-family HTH domain